MPCTHAFAPTVTALHQINTSGSYHFCQVEPKASAYFRCLSGLGWLADWLGFVDFCMRWFVDSLIH